MQYLVGKLLKTPLKFIEYTTERAYSKYTMSYKKPSFNTPPRGHQVQVLERRELDALDDDIDQAQGQMDVVLDKIGKLLKTNDRCR